MVVDVEAARNGGRKWVCLEGPWRKKQVDSACLCWIIERKFCLQVTITDPLDSQLEMSNTQSGMLNLGSRGSVQAEVVIWGHCMQVALKL